MRAIFFRLCPNALLLKNEAYEDMRAMPSPFVKGLILIAVVGMITSLVGIVGTTLEWATTPDLKAIKDIVWEGMMEMPWVQEIPPEEREGVMEAIQRQYNRGWQIFPRFFGAPHPTSAILGVVTNPITLLIRWLIYALLAHLFARLLGGEGKLGQTYGCTALAASPQLLKLAQLLPYVNVGGVVSIWTLICNYLAVKVAHRLSWGRAFWATVLPLIVLGLIIAILVSIGAFAIGSLITRGGAR